MNKNAYSTIDLSAQTGIKIKGHRVRRLWNQCTIRKRFFILLMTIVLLSLLLLGTATYGIVYGVVRKSNQASYTSILESSGKILEDKLTTLKEITRLIVADDNIQSELSKASEMMEDEYFFPFQSANLLYEALVNYTTDINDIDSLYLYDVQGRLFYLDMKTNRAQLIEQLSYFQIQKEYWFQEAIRQQGRELFFSYDVMGLDQEDQVISCVKVLNNLESLDRIGLLVLNVKKQAFSTVFPGTGDKQEWYSIEALENGQFQAIYQTGEQRLMTERLTEAVLSGERYLDEDGNLVTIDYHDSTGFWLIHSIARQEVFADVRYIGLATSCVAGITALGALLVSSLFSASITKPLEHLKTVINQVGKGKRDIPDVFGDDEVGIIGNEFRNMVKENWELNEKVIQYSLKQREAEIQALQAQINPHFLYNTLDSIYWLAILDKNQKIADMTHALSETFRISLNKGEKLITVQKEIEMVKNYLLIQNLRYNGRILYQINVDEDIYEYEIIKLMLQPFVENAMYHGLEPKIGEGTIVIEGYVKDELLIFHITDDGVGMVVDEQIYSGYGIRNVMERIKLYYGEAYGISFQSEPGKGTAVELRLPYKGEQDV